jgi:hypothetical protein
VDVAAWLLAAVLAIAAPAALTRGPVVTQPSPTGAVVSWSMARPAPSSVRIDGRTVFGATARSPRIRLAGLAPGRRYAYAIGSGGHVLARGSLRTAPPPTGTFTAAVFGDYGSSGAGERAVARLTARWRPDLAVTTGDNVYLLAIPGLFDPNLFRPLAPLLRVSSLVPALGNHDEYLDGGRALLGALTLPGAGRYYVQRYGAATFVVLDSNRSLAPGTPQGRFLAAALRGARSSCFRFVVLHHPPFSLHSGGIAGHLRRYLVPAIERAGVQLALLGHVHAYERSRVRHRVTYLTVGTGGAELGEGLGSRVGDASTVTGSYGALRLVVGPRRAAGAFVSVDGRVRDRFALTCAR